ncbi:MAG: pilin [Candidatus Saccharimonadales bacterium]
MIKKLKISVLALLTFSLFATPILAPVAVSAAADATQSGLCQGANLEVTPGSGVADCAIPDPTDKVNSTLTLVINIFSLVVGVAAVIMIIVGGLRYIISGGDSGNVTSAKNTILYAIIGLVVVALAQFIVKFVLTKVGGPA